MNRPATKQDLFETLNQLGIAYSTVEHPPFFTVEEGLPWHDKIPGLHCKNLFLKNKKGQMWLVVLPCEKRADLRTLEKALDAGRLSFGKPDLLEATLGITPGSVTPFALLNDTEKKVCVVLDHDMLEAETVNYHPLKNDASTTLRAKDLLKFVKSLGYEPAVLDCGPWQEAANDSRN